MREKIPVLARATALGFVISILTPGIVSSRTDRRDRWQLPLAMVTKVTSCYGPRRLLDKFRDFHEGIDFHAQMKTPVVAVADGRVIWEGPSGCAGRTLVVEHTLSTGQTVFSIYKHLRGYLVKPGDVVSSGQHVAMSGAS